MAVKLDDPRDIQGAYEDRFNNSSEALQKAEGTSLSPAGTALADQADAFLREHGNTKSESVAAQNEQNSGEGWKLNRTIGAPKSNDGFGQKALKFMKKGGPTVGISGGIIAAVFGISTLSGPALLLNHLTAGFLEKWDTRTTTATIRTNKLIVNKLVGNSTSGSCNYVKLMCRYNKPSNALLKKLEKNNIVAVDKKGNSIQTKKLWPNTRPDHYTFTDSKGLTKNITAAQLAPTLANDAEFRNAFHTAYNTRFQNFADSSFRNVLSFFGTSKADKLEGAKDIDTANEKINTASKGEDIGAKGALAEGDEAVEGVAKRLLSEEMSEIFQKLGKAGKGDTTGLIAGAACLLTDAPGVAVKVARAYQTAQLVKLAMVFLPLADKIRTGAATAEQVSSVGALLTTSYKDNSGIVTNRAAVDSFGIKNALFGDTDTSTETAGHSFKKFQPGSSVINSLSGVTAITNSDAKKKFCEAATNPLTGGAINIALASTGPGVIAAALNIAIGTVVGWGLEQAAQPLADFIVPIVQPAFEAMLGGLLGDFTADLKGEDLGNAFAAGTSLMLSRAANVGGNVPLSVEDASDFVQVQHEVNLAYAEEDRLSASPFDASNPNTFMGSIVGKLIPYSSQMSSVSGALASIWSVSLGSIGVMIAPTTSAANTANEYTLCDDPTLNTGEVAVGAFCNVTYAIPKKYLGTDPTQVTEYMVSSGNVDEDTGEPISGQPYDDWLTLCGDDDSSQAANCKIDAKGVSEAQSKVFANFALYRIDHQIQKNMDDEDDRSSASSAISGSIPSISGLPNGGVKDTTEGRKQAWALAQQFITDLNKIRKNGKGYPFKNISNDTLGYNKSAGTPGNSASGGPCFDGASNCDQCYALTAWFLEKFTSLKIGTTTSSGDGVVAYLKSKGVPTGDVAKVYSVFSYGRAVGGTGAHTGIVIGIDGDYAITLENNYNFDGTLYINKRPISGDKFRGNGQKTVFAYINESMAASPKEF